jgi:hypothetical protein
LSAFIYFPITSVLLLRFKFLEIPKQYNKYIPQFLNTTLFGKPPNEI